MFVFFVNRVLCSCWRHTEQWYPPEDDNSDLEDGRPAAKPDNVYIIIIIIYMWDK